MSSSENLGELVRTTRLNQGITQKELAEKSGVSRTSVLRVDRDAMNVSFSTLKRIVKFGLGGELEL
ncbi:MAG: helix-turn-helix domain-containing protein [Blastocatellia bacterium]